MSPPLLHLLWQHSGPREKFYEILYSYVHAKHLRTGPCTYKYSSVTIIGVGALTKSTILTNKSPLMPPSTVNSTRG